MNETAEGGKVKSLTGAVVVSFYIVQVVDSSVLSLQISHMTETHTQKVGILLL